MNNPPEKTPTWVWMVGLGVAAAVIYFGGRFFRDVMQTLSSWRPSADAKNESDHRKALAEFMRVSLPDYRLIEEYSHEKSRADIVIGNSIDSLESSSEKFAIELKFRLKAKAEIDRLVGQCVGYRTLGFEKAFIILIDPEPSSLEVLRSRVELDTLSGFLTLVAPGKGGPN